MKHVFLSASIPDPARHQRYYSTSDVVAVRDAVRALATVALPHAVLYWGGHPAITPLIRAVAESLNFTTADRVRLFQSAWFSNELPSDNAAFERVDIIPARGNRDLSLRAMREAMMAAASFDAGVFIAGMEGVEEEFAMFRQMHPNALVLPVASTGAAAAILYQQVRTQLQLPTDLAFDYAFPSLFRRLLELPEQLVGG